MITIKTIKKGECIGVWNRIGDFRVVAGPRRVFLFNSKIEELERYTAEPNQYIRIQLKDGTKKHIPGPKMVWFNPVDYESVSILKAIDINSHEAIVIYRKINGNVERQVVKGPALHIPAENEWIHQFRWHGSESLGASRKVPRALNFEKLRTIPDQMYHNVQDVRTADDALIEIKLMIFFELADIEKMLDQTHDPVGDFINAVTADVIDFVAKLSFEEFKENTEALNQMGTYRALNTRMETIGYKLKKVVYRGYFANEKLQSMHDNAIETRTQLNLEAETERQAQELEDMRVIKEMERAKRKQEIDKRETIHKNEMNKMAHQEKIRQKQIEHETQIDLIRKKNDLEIVHKKEMNKEEETFLKAIKDFGVDLTKYMVAQYQSPDKLIRIDTKSDKQQLHVHEK